MELLQSMLVFLTSVQAQAVEQGDGISWMLTVPIFIGMLVVLVFFHELGHFVTALWMGIRVEEFGIGFPPRALTLFERNGVSYTLNWLPLGGFVRFGGEDNSVYGTGSLAEAPPWRKIPVMFAGPLMNLVLAVIIFAGLFTFNGIPTTVGQHVSAVYDAPAKAAGIQEGDVITRLDGQPVDRSQDDLKNIASANIGEPIDVTIQRGDEELTLTVTPGDWELDGVTRQGLGISYFPERTTSYVNPLIAILASLLHTAEVLVIMLMGLGQLIGGLFGVAEAPPGGLTGPVGIARATGEVINNTGFVGFWNWMAIISLNLFVLNLLPIPALDGSHIIFSLIEWVRGGKKIPPEKEALVHAIGFATLIGLIVLVSVSDVMNAINDVPVLPQ